MLALILALSLLDEISAARIWKQGYKVLSFGFIYGRV